MPLAQTRSALLLASAALFLSGCATLVPRGDRNLNPTGQTLRVIAANGAESRMQFRSDGRVVAAFGERSITGSWEMEGENLCFRWGQAPRECWPYEGAFPQGRTVTITSDRGNVVRVTRL